MNYLKLALVGLFCLVLTKTVLASNQPEVAEEILSEGLRANDEFLEFLDHHSCELGIVPNCDRPMSVTDIAKLKDLFRRLDSWKREAFESLLPLHDKLQGRSFVIKDNVPHAVRSGLGRLVISLKANEPSTQGFIESVYISAVIKLVMYDSFFRLSLPLSKAKKMRAILASDMGSDGRIFYDTFKVALDKKNWKRTEIDLNFLKLSESYYQKNSFFQQYLQNSFTANRMKEKDQSYRIQNLLLLGTILRQAELGEALERIMGKISEFFGNTIGQFQTRDGKLKKLIHDPQTMGLMKRKLRPLDILFEKTPFRLTDQFIPGFYGHVAIWLGRPEELIDMKVEYQGREIPLLDHPKILPFLEKMSQGKLVVEALRKPGVTMNTLEHFMDVDDLVVVRPDNIENPAQHILKALELIGRPYDFNFDVETENAIVCSELVYQVFDQMEWPIEREMGRYTISPDHVAWKAVDSCFRPVMMYHDGMEVTKNLTGELRRLLDRPGGISYTPRGGHCL